MTSPDVHILIASATSANVQPVLDLADEHRVAMTLDGRCNHSYDTIRLEQLLGPCYARLPDDPRVRGLVVGKIAGIASSWRDRTCILVLADTDQVEPFSTVVKAACPSGVKVEVARKGSEPQNGGAYEGGPQ